MSNTLKYQLKNRKIFKNLLCDQFKEPKAIKSFDCKKILWLSEMKRRM